MAASQNGFCSYKLSFNEKTNIMQIMTKNIKIFIYLRNCENRSFYGTLLELCSSTVFSAVIIIVSCVHPVKS